MGARTKMTEGMDDMIEVLRQPELMEQIPSVNRDNFVKHLTITKLKIENAIAKLERSLVETFPALEGVRFADPFAAGEEFNLGAGPAGS